MSNGYDIRSRELYRTVFFLDVLLSLLAFLAAFYLRNRFLPGEEAPDLYAHLSLIPLLLALLLFFLSYFGAYQPPRHISLLGYGWSTFRAIALTIGVLLTLLFFFDVHYVSPLVVLLFAGMSFVFLFLVRLWASYHFQRSIREGRSDWRVLIVGTGERAREMARALRVKSDWGFRVVGHLDPDPSLFGTQIDGVPVIGSVRNVSLCLKNNVVDEVILAIPRSLLGNTEPIVHACEEEGIKLQIMANFFDTEGSRVTLSHVGPIPLLSVEPVAQDEGKLFAKRVFDLVLTTAALPFVLPLMALVALAIKIDSPGPVLFVQQRVGLRKHLFPMFKFRSMHPDAEERLKDIEHLNEATGPIFKITDDPRATRVGRFLRNTSLDELPQLFNVLRGEMSLVGPRPMSIRDVELFDRGIQRKRFSVKPGITCLWQVSGRSSLPFEKWLELDLQYIKTWSLWLDFKILLKTIPAVILRKGAM